jgi:hypothetical protein
MENVNMMKKFVVSAPSWFASSGGITILHKLVQTLNELGYDAYLAPSSPSGLGWHPAHIPFEIPARYDKIKLITQEVYDNLHDAIVVYPETWYGNYLNAPNVVRWIMGPANPRYMSAGSGWGMQWEAWKDTDLWFWYTQLYTTPTFNSTNKDTTNTLYLGEFYRDIFFNKNGDRTLNCWTLRKATGLVDPKDYIHEPGDLFLGDIDKSLPNPDYDLPGNFNVLADLFNHTNRFYSYDPYTFVSVQAIMCGADSIVAPRTGLSKEEYLQGYPLHKYIAYGLNDLERSKSVRSELLEDLDKIETDSIKSIHNFTQKCYDYFKGF